MRVGKAIREIRRSKNITQIELSEKCNLSQTALSQIESLNKRPHEATLKIICKKLGVTESRIYLMSMPPTEIWEYILAARPTPPKYKTKILKNQ